MIAQAETRLALAFKASLRSLSPIVVLLLTLYATGEIKVWQDVYSPRTIGAILAAMGVKGLVSYATAKDVQVKS